MEVATRLKEERERLGLSQSSFGALAGAGKTTVINWEKGASAPDAVQLSAFAAAGADVQYILTGVRTGPGILTQAQQLAGYSVEVLSKEEQALLDNYRHSPEVGKKIIEAAVSASAQPAKVKKRGPGM